MHLIKVRNACELSHLIGSAPVIYGMPFSCEDFIWKIFI